VGLPGCPNAVFTERHLPSLTAFAAFTEDQREALDSAQWQARYGTAHHRLTTGIFPAFTSAQHAAARHDSTCSTAALPARLLEILTYHDHEHQLASRNPGQRRGTGSCGGERRR
jgi:hypothetical protein